MCLYVIKLSCETLLCPILRTKAPNWITNVSKMPARNALLVLIGDPGAKLVHKCVQNDSPKQGNNMILARLSA